MRSWESIDLCLLIQFRKWHSWGGLLLSVLILMVAVTGILMNHKDLVFHGGKNKPAGVLRSTTDLDGVPVSITQALALAHVHYGDVSLEKIELKDEDGRLIYKVSQGGGKEVRIDGLAQYTQSSASRSSRRTWRSVFTSRA